MGIFVKNKERIRCMKLIGVLILIGIGAYCMFNFLKGSLGLCMNGDGNIRLKLIDIEKIVLHNKKDSITSECVMDMQEFRKLIPNATYKGLVITKGAGYEGEALMKNGQTIKVVASKMYPVLFVDVREDSIQGYVFNEKVKEQWFELLKATLE